MLVPAVRVSRTEVLQTVTKAVPLHHGASVDALNILAKPARRQLHKKTLVRHNLSRTCLIKLVVHMLRTTRGYVSNIRARASRHARPENGNNPYFYSYIKTPPPNQFPYPSPCTNLQTRVYTIASNRDVTKHKERPRFGRRGNSPNYTLLRLATTRTNLNHSRRIKPLRTGVECV